MSQIALPFAARGPVRIVVGNGNRAAIEALREPGEWPFQAAVLLGPPRSGKTLLARAIALAAPGARVHVTFAGREATAQAAADGRWSLALPAQTAGGPHVMRIDDGAQAHVLSDVLVGDVWLASLVQWVTGRASAADVSKSMDVAVRLLLR